MARELTEITVIGEDKTGLIANVTTLLFERGISIEDLDQAVREGIFRIVLHTGTAEMIYSHDGLRATLSDLGGDLGVNVQVRFPSDRETREITVLVTKESHCLEVLFEMQADDDLGAEISVAIDNHDTFEPLVSHYDVPFHDVGDEKGTTDEERLLGLLERYDVNLIILTHYMRILSPNVIFRYEGHVINIHPSLLPAFPNTTVYRQAKEEGVHIASATAHYVTIDLDQGLIVAQRIFDVPDDASIDETRRRGQPLGADALLEAMKSHLSNDMPAHRGRTNLRKSAGPKRYQPSLICRAQASNLDRPVGSIVDTLGERETLVPEPSED